MHEYPVEIERRMLARVDAVDMRGRPLVWYLVGKFFGSCDAKLIFFVIRSRPLWTLILPPFVNRTYTDPASRILHSRFQCLAPRQVTFLSRRMPKGVLQYWYCPHRSTKYFYTLSKYVFLDIFLIFDTTDRIVLKYPILP